MSKFTITFNTDNAAFDSDISHEIAVILRTVADHVGAGMEKGRYATVPVRDTNGNTIGKYTYSKG